MITVPVAFGDLFSMANGLLTRLAGLGGLALVLVVGVIALGHVGHHRAGAAVSVVLLAMIPAWFLLDPTGAMSTLKSTVSSLPH